MTKKGGTNVGTYVRAPSHRTLRFIVAANKKFHKLWNSEPHPLELIPVGGSTLNVTH